MSKAPYQLKPDPRRWYERLELDCPVRLTSGDQAWETRLGDISNGGCRLLKPAGCTLQVDDLVTVHVMDAERPSQMHALTGRIARVSDRHLGIGFQPPEDPLRFGG